MRTQDSARTLGFVRIAGVFFSFYFSRAALVGYLVLYLIQHLSLAVHEEGQVHEHLVQL